MGLGAALHGFVPEEWVETHLGQGHSLSSVPVAAFVGIPLAFYMITVAASFSEFILLKQIMQWHLLALLLVVLLTAISLVGWMFNFAVPYL